MPLTWPAGQSYQDACGHQQSQGYLLLRLHDKVVGQDLVVATTHLKAKEGDENSAVRHLQVGRGWLGRGGLGALPLGPVPRPCP